MAQRTHRLVQLTDTHIVDEDKALYTKETLPDGRVVGAVDSAANLAHALEVAGEYADGLTALLLTGDLANDGTPDAYRRLRAMVDPVAERLGVPAIYGMGNHDHRDTFRTGLLDGAPAPAGATYGGTEADGERDLFAPVDYVVELDGLRLVMVDSTVPGSHHGALSDAQLAWLESTLAVPAPAGTIVTLHHPPFHGRDDGPEAALMASVRFASTRELADTLRGRDVLVVLAGHWHEPYSGQIGGVPVWAGPSSAMAHHIGDGMFRIVPSSGFSVIDVFDDGTVVTRAINCLERPVLHEFSMDELLQRIAVSAAARG